MTLRLAILFLSAGLVCGQIMPTNRTPGGAGNWIGLAGIPGGIPSTNRTVSASFPAGTSLSTIQNAINSNPNSIIRLGAGTFSFSGNQLVISNGVTVIGAGMGVTVINSSHQPAVIIGNDNWYNAFRFMSTGNSEHVSWTNGFNQGATTIQVSSVHSSAVGDLQIGMFVFLDQLNDTNATASTGTGSGCDPGGYSSLAFPYCGQDRYRFQVNRVKNIVGTTITLEAPILMPNWDTNLAPQMWWYGFQPVTNCGLESLTVNGSGEDVDVHNAAYCWVRNVEMIGVRYYCNPVATFRCEYRRNYIHGPIVNTDSYGFSPHYDDCSLYEDNICAGGQGGLTGFTGIILNGNHGCVFTYNYVTNTTGAGPWMGGGVFLHGGDPNMNLFEGNVAPGWWVQDYWGSSEYNTAFRNRFTGLDEGNYLSVYSSDIEAINLSCTQRCTTVIGNILGTIGRNTWYEDTTNFQAVGASGCHAGGRVWYTAEGNGGCAVFYDVVTASTLSRIMNWDSSHQAIFDANGHVIGDLPKSLVYASAPSYFNSLPWPPMDPTSPSYSMSRTNIPAGYRFIRGTDPPAGGPIPPSSFMNTMVVSNLTITGGP